MKQKRTMPNLLLYLYLITAAVPASSIPSLDPSDLSFLRSLPSYLHDLPGSTFISAWDFEAQDPCNFPGVVCSASVPEPESPLRITSLALGSGLSDSPGLAGTLPPSLSSLPNLTQLILFPGRVAGPLPTAFPTSLAFVSITGNLISGSIPQSLASLPDLHTLDLSRNRLSATIPPSLLSHPNLKVLILASNGYLSGDIPAITAPLLHLDLQSNAFTGPLPAFPPTLRYVSANTNFLSGDLLPVSALPELAFLDLSRNSLSGTIPPSLFSPPIILLLLNRNNLTGTMPPVLGNVGPAGKGWTVDISHNRLSGELTAVLAGAESVYVNNNRFIGTVPSEYAKSVLDGTLRTFYAQHNFLTGFDFPLTEGGGSPLPESTALCLAYNCMESPPVGPALCPGGVGEVSARPRWQCPVFGRGERGV